MAVLDKESRDQIWAEFMRNASNVQEEIRVNKVDLKLAVERLDDYLDTITKTINEAFPEPARTELTIKQKMRIFFMVQQERYKKDVVKDSDTQTSPLAPPLKGRGEEVTHG